MPGKEQKLQIACQDRMSWAAIWTQEHWCWLTRAAVTLTALVQVMADCQLFITSADVLQLGYVLRASDQRARASMHVKAIGVFLAYVTATS